MPFFNDSEREKRKRVLKKNMKVNHAFDDEYGYSERERMALEESDAGGAGGAARGIASGIASGIADVSEDNAETSSKPKKGSKLLAKFDPKAVSKKMYILLAVIVVAVIGLIVLGARTLGAWRSVDTRWTVDMPDTDRTGYAVLGGGMVRYSSDGAAFYDASGTNTWNEAYEIAHPVSAVSSNYVVVADCGGRDLVVLDPSGCVGRATSTHDIVKADISDNGYVAVIGEADDAAFINYFNPDGSAIDIEIRTVLGGEGYPVDLSLSSDGKLLMVAYAFVDGGALRSRVVFYNFSAEGENTEQRIVGGFEQYDTSVVGDVEMLGGDDAVAIAEDRLTFFSLTNTLSPQQVDEIAVEGQIRSVAVSSNRIAIVKDSETEGMLYDVTIYGPSGSTVGSFSTDLNYTNIEFTGGYLVLSNTDTCEIRGNGGDLKYSGALAGSISRVYSVSGNWYQTGGGELTRFVFGAV